MNVGPNYKKGRKHEIIKLLYMVGVIPYKSLPLISPPPVMTRRAVNEMTKEGIVVVDKKGEEKNIRLQNRKERKDEYEPYLSEELIENYETQMYGRIGKMSSKGENVRMAKKVLKDSAAQILMYASGIGISIDNPDIDACQSLEGETAYYSSEEIKSCESLGKKNQASRISGVLISPGGVYPTYCMGEALITWKQVSERKMAVSAILLAKQKGCQKQLSGLTGIEEKECIVITADHSQFVRICRLDYSKRKNIPDQTKLINIDYTYDHMYAVPNDENGKMLLQMMSSENWKEKIYNSLLTKEERDAVKTSTVSCDGYRSKDGVYVYVFCVPDLTRLKTFLNRANLENTKNKFVIYCYSFQLPIIYGIIERNNVTVMQIDLATFKQKIFE